MRRLCGALAVLAAGCGGPTTPAADGPRPRPGDEAPAFAALAELRGKVVLLDFWQTDCPPCATVAASARALLREHRDDAFAVLGVSLDADEAAFLKAVASSPWPSVRDADGRLAAAYGVEATPALFLIDRRGVVRCRYDGPASDFDLRQDVGLLLAEGH